MDLLGSPATRVASAMVTDVPYPLFERNEEIWLKTLSNIVLNKTERGDFADLSGSASRRTEWLFGRIAAKEAVRRFLNRQGVALNRMATISYGQEQPVASNDTPEGRAQNRRVELRIIPVSQEQMQQHR